MDTIETLLRDPDQGVRWSAANAFEKIVAQGDLEKVRSMVRSQTVEGRVAGVRALALPKFLSMGGVRSRKEERAVNAREPEGVSPGAVRIGELLHEHGAGSAAVA